MLDKYISTELKDNQELNRFEMDVDAQTAILEYKRDHETIALLHTEVPESLEGMGVAAALVEKVLTKLENEGFKIIPYCPYVQSFLKRHPDWNRIVA